MHGQHKNPKSDIEIAQGMSIASIETVAEKKLGISADNLLLYGPYKAKLAPSLLKALRQRAIGKLILVTGMTPSRSGEGKTTTAIGLGDALNHLGKNTVTCLREPSLGPCFGRKGGATGGGYAQVLPMEDINLHFNGDIHAIGSANNLLAALVDNHIHWGNALNIDCRRVSLHRTVDLNDRALRHIAIALGGLSNGVPREEGFDIVAASEAMAVFCLADDLMDLKRRLGNMIVGETTTAKAVRASDLGAAGAMTALLKDALAPNLVQSLEGNPVLVHGGPFGNIAHGCNSVISTKAALGLADYVVVEAGFGTDLGAEKFFDIKCRQAGIQPDCAVVVATVRALKLHGDVAEEDLRKENVEAVERGIENLAQHVSNVRRFGVPVLVALNRFSHDTEEEISVVVSECARTLNVPCIVADHWAHGGRGAVELAVKVLDILKTEPAAFKTLYSDGDPLWTKVQTIAREMYCAGAVVAEEEIRNQFTELDSRGFGNLPICMAKTQYSLTADPRRKGAPRVQLIPIRGVRLFAGAEFVVVVCGNLVTMPGMPKVSSAERVDVVDGRIRGLS